MEELLAAEALIEAATNPPDSAPEPTSASSGVVSVAVIVTLPVAVAEPPWM